MLDGPNSQWGTASTQVQLTSAWYKCKWSGRGRGRGWTQYHFTWAWGVDPEMAF